MDPRRELSQYAKYNLVRNADNYLDSKARVRSFEKYVRERPTQVFRTAAERNLALQLQIDEMKQAPWKLLHRVYEHEKVFVITPDIARRLIGQRIAIIDGSDLDDLIPGVYKINNGYVLDYRDDDRSGDDDRRLRVTSAKITHVDAKGVWMVKRNYGLSERSWSTWSTNRPKKILLTHGGYPVMVFGKLVQSMTKNTAARKIQRAVRVYQQRLKVERARIQKQRNWVHNELRALPPGVFHPSFPGGANTLAAKARFEQMQRVERNLKRSLNIGTRLTKRSKK